VQVIFGASVARACVLFRLSWALYYYRRQRHDSAGLRLRIRELAEVRTLGRQRTHVPLRWEGWRVKFKRVRLRKRVSLHRRVPTAASRPHERWSIGLVHDALVDRRPSRVLTVVDQ
jgi:putative transposase